MEKKEKKKGKKWVVFSLLGVLLLMVYFLFFRKKKDTVTDSSETKTETEPKNETPKEERTVVFDVGVFNLEKSIFPTVEGCKFFISRRKLNVIYSKKKGFEYKLYFEYIDSSAVGYNSDFEINETDDGFLIGFGGMPFSYTDYNGGARAKIKITEK